MSFETIVKDIEKVSSDASMRFMHPWASGNISVVCDEIPSGLPRTDEWSDVGVLLPNLANKNVLISTAGSHIANIPDEAEHALGLIEFSSDGSQYRKLWGFKGFKNRPTSELDTHARILDIEGSGAVIHDHPLATNAMMLAGHASSCYGANRILWMGSTEGIAYLPGGLGHLQWRVPGTPELGLLTEKSFRDGFDAVLWDRHGLVAHAEDVKSAYGKIQTIEHAMSTVQQAMATLDNLTMIKWLKMSDLKQMIDAFKLNPNPKVLEVLERGE